MMKDKPAGKYMRYKIVLLSVILVMLGYGMGCIGEAVYNSDAITLER